MTTLAFYSVPIEGPVKRKAVVPGSSSNLQAFTLEQQARGVEETLVVIDDQAANQAGQRSSRRAGAHRGEPER